MEVKDVQKIGNHFKKDNIFIATVFCNSEEAKKMIAAAMGESALATDATNFTDKGIISAESVELYYKNEAGYTYFDENGPHTLIGDNSDGKGELRNIVSAWDYFSANQIYECVFDNKYVGIAVVDDKPFNKYNDDFNK